MQLLSQFIINSAKLANTVHVALLYKKFSWSSITKVLISVGVIYFILAFVCHCCVDVVARFIQASNG